MPLWGPKCSSASHVQAAEGVCGPLAGKCQSWTWSQATDVGTEGTTQEPKLALHSASLRAIPKGTARTPRQRWGQTRGTQKGRPVSPSRQAHSLGWAPGLRGDSHMGVEGVTILGKREDRRRRPLVKE